MAIGGDAFDQFRRNREVKKLGEQLRTRVQVAREEISRKIACAEEAEEIERRVINEMREFFHEATRLAAQVLTEIHRRRSSEINARVEEEIDTFFEETKQHALKALDDIRTETAAKSAKK